MKKTKISAFIIAALVILAITTLLFIIAYSSLVSKADISFEIFKAIEAGDTETARSLIDAHPECINVHPQTGPDAFRIIFEQYTYYYPLQEACFRGNVEIVALLLENGADCNLVKKRSSLDPNDFKDSPAIVLAAQHENDEIAYKMVKLLLEHGANINQKGQDGITAFDCAVENGNTALIKLLESN